MALTTEGIKTKIEFEGLQPNEGWTIKINVELDSPTEEAGNANHKAHELGIAGRILNGHEDDFGLVVNRINTELSNLRNEWVQFIQDWNAGVYE